MKKIVVILVILAVVVLLVPYIENAAQQRALATATNFDKINIGMTDADVQAVLGPPHDTENNPTLNPKARGEKASDGFVYCHDGFLAGRFDRWNDSDGVHIYRVQMTNDRVSGIVAIDGSKFQEDTSLISGLAQTMTLGGSSGDWENAKTEGVRAKGQVKVVPKY